MWPGLGIVHAFGSDERDESLFGKATCCRSQNEASWASEWLGEAGVLVVILGEWEEDQPWLATSICQMVNQARRLLVEKRQEKPEPS